MGIFVILFGGVIILSVLISKIQEKKEENYCEFVDKVIRTSEEDKKYFLHLENQLDLNSSNRASISEEELNQTMKNITNLRRSNKILQDQIREFSNKLNTK